MKETLVVMAILGCADAGDHCRTVHTVPSAFESLAACNEAAARVLPELTDLDYPVVMAECRREQRQVEVAAAKPRR